MKLYEVARKYGAKVAVAAAPVLVPAMVWAQEAEGAVFDAGPQATKILGLIAGALAIGGAVFALHLAIRSTKWGRKAL